MTTIEPILQVLDAESRADENWSEYDYCEFLVDYPDLTIDTLSDYLFIGAEPDLLAGAVVLLGLLLRGCGELRSGDESRWAKLRGFAHQSDHSVLAMMADWALMVADEQTYHIERLWAVLLMVYQLHRPDVEQLRLL